MKLADSRLSEFSRDRVARLAPCLGVMPATASGFSRLSETDVRETARSLHKGYSYADAIDCPGLE